ncbi:hypothetical protein M0R45_004946 [Rubus argutus]|uniref:Protein kinase domain-containing protein n=1 Tax=Rubus argutus TaxID=59490 RepID=A0AAW1YLB9_RUBAR
MNIPCLPINVLIFLLILPSACSIYFKIPRFDATAANIVYEGDAVPAVGVIELIDKVNYVCRVGRATYAERVPLWDSHAGKLTDFTTHFSFIIDTQGAANYGSGFGFFLAPFGSPIPPNSAGGFLGLFNTTTSDFAGNQIVLVEFDSYVNPEWDPAYQHVGINNNSIASVVNTRWNVSLHDGDTTDVWITYNATTTILSVHWSYQTTPASAEETTSLSYQIDLMKVLPEWITIGFSAGTSQYMERNKIVSWEFNSTLDRKYPGSSRGIHAKKTIMIIVITLLAVSVVSLIVGMIAAKTLGLWCSRLKKNTKEEETVSVPAVTNTGNLTPIIEESSEGEAGPGMFTYPNIATATNNFSNDRKLGEGGSGDFGLARIMYHEQDPKTTELAGTFGYVDPEYIVTGKASRETDVYSFGVVALEIATGKKSVYRMGKNSGMGLVEWVWDLYGQGKLFSAVDERLHWNYDEKQVECLMLVGLWCAHPDKNQRPSIREAIQYLNFDVGLPRPPMGMPSPVYQVPTPLPSIISGASLSTTSLQEGR